jgi:chemotaxis protein CheC
MDTSLGTEDLGLLELSAVREITNIGLGHAITALTIMTQRPFNMSVPSAQSIAMTSLPSVLGDERVYVGIYMAVEGDVEGHMAFLFPWDSAMNLWAMILGSAPKEPGEVSEFEASALIEIGNIINGSFLNAIAEMTGFTLYATPPVLAVDMSFVILESIVAEASLGEHVALSIETEIFDEARTAGGMFLFIPTMGGLKKVFRALGLPEAA